MKKVIIKLQKDGGIIVEANGYKGGKCLEKTKFIEDIFGEPQDRTLKPSFYEEEETETVFQTNGVPSGWCG